MEDSFCHHEKLGYCKLKKQKQIKLVKNKHQTSYKSFEIEQITNEIKVEVEN